MTLLALLGMALFGSLGVWQLKRAEGKREIIAKRAEAQKLPAVALSESPQAFQKVFIKGTPLPDTLYLDNQFHQHQFGYHVITPILLPNNQVVLLNRGYIRGTHSREVLPEVPALKTEEVFEGTIYIPSKKAWVLGSGFEERGANQAIIESYDFEVIQQFLHKSVYPFIMRQSTEAKDGLVREWVDVVMPPSRHMGYAFQWFALALVVLIVYIALNLKKLEEAPSS